MSDQQVTEIAARREPWNKGRLTGQKRPLRPKDVWAIRVRLQIGGLERDLAPLQSGDRQQTPGL